MTAAPSPFRAGLVDAHLAPDQLDALVRINDARGWIAGLGLALIALFALGWGVFGSVLTEVSAPGILVLDGAFLTAVSSPASGTLVELRVHAGDQVGRGTVVAVVRQTELARQLNDARAVLREREATLAARRGALDRELAAKGRTASAQDTTIADTIAARDQRIARLRSQLAAREDLRRRGLIIEDQVEQARVALAQAREDSGAMRSQRLEIDGGVQEARFAAQHELDTLAQAAAEARRTVADLDQGLRLAAQIEAPVAGRVTEVTSAVGAAVSPGAPLLVIETGSAAKARSAAPLGATIYVPTMTGKRVRPGMAVRIEPSMVRREDHGMLLGQVATVSAFPASPAGMAALLQNPRLADAFAAGSAPYQATVTLRRAGTASGYAWTTGSGPAMRLSSGTPVTAHVAVARDRPIVLLMPFLRRVLPGTTLTEPGT